jgi:U1 small nuclear ribonucleoprotein
MTDQLPPNLRALFTARPALKYLQPHDHAQEERCTRRITGIAQFLPQLEAYKATDVYNATESHHQRQTRLKEEKKAAHLALMESAPTDCESPRNNGTVQANGTNTSSSPLFHFSNVSLK